MSDIVIRVENLSKKYVIGHQKQERYTALRDVIADKVRGLGNIFNRHAQEQDEAFEEFWALKDVSFEIKQGDRVGIIGRNGAGKSTLLKVLSRITEPTSGKISIKGRVASLLEVGTGFHPELTGRENVYLNGAILGMDRVEIKKKFDEIVAFAEVERFLDTPVKRYSSGMYVRLAFAVAAHLEPEILIVDEVLAVGDAQFQKKCLGKMEDVSHEGRIIIFVSHNLSIIQALCQRCLVLQAGNLKFDQPTLLSVQGYLEDDSIANTFVRSPAKDGKPTIISGLVNLKTNEVEISIVISTNYAKVVSIDLRIMDSMGIPVGFGSLGTLNPSQLINLRAGVNQIVLLMPTDKLAIGDYYIGLDVTLPDVETYDRLEKCLSFEVNRPPINNAKRVLSQSWGYGSFEIPLKLSSS